MVVGERERPMTEFEKMYDEFLTYYASFRFFKCIDTMGIAMTRNLNITDDGVARTSDELVKHFFSQYAHKDISDEQAASFSPIFFLMSFSRLKKSQEKDEIRQELKELFENKDFWDITVTSFERYFSIEPYLIQELDKLHELHPETAGENGVQLVELKALLLAYKELPENELEPYFEKCRSGERVWQGTNGGTYAAINKYFEHTYKAVKAARQALEDVKFIGIPIVPELKAYTHYVMASDKLNNALLNIPIGIKTPIKVESNKDHKNGIEANTYVLINFNNLGGLKISETLEPYDQDIINSISNVILNQIQNGITAPFYMTPNLIYEVMPKSKSKLNATERKKIDDYIRKLKHGDVFIDNSEETEIYDKYDQIDDEYPILDVKRTRRAYYKGKLVKQVYVFNDIPIIFKYALDRGQVTTIRKEIAETPLKLTAATSKLVHYLWWRIDRINHGIERNNKIMLVKLCDKCGIKTPKQKERALDKLPEILQHFVKTNFIKDYKINKDSITIVPNNKYDDE